jgi:signal transduction histidine kinase
MAAIKNSTYYLKLKLKEDNLIEHLEIIDKEITRSDEVIRRLLEITKGEDLKKENTDIQVIAEEAMNYANINKNSELCVKFRPHPFTLNVDKLLFRQVLHNLFSNSIEAMPDGGLITLDANRIKNNWAELTIKDEGAGIDQHSIRKIFDPLFTGKKDGIGLGLSLCRDLIARHGGTIRATSEKNQGAKIIIKIPIS